MHKIKRWAITIIFFGIWGWSDFASPTQMQGKSFVHVLKVIDGDSFLAIHEGDRIEVRLWGIDCPEWTQPYARNAKKMTRKMIEGRDVRIWVKDQDRYGRLVAMVYIGSRNINAELVKNGSAWVYSRYCNEPICNRWTQYQQQAAREKRGIWSRSHVVPPWQWRRRRN